MKIVKVKKDSSSNYKQFKLFLNLLKINFGTDWNTAYEKIVNDLSVAELEEMSKLAGPGQAAKLIKAAKNFITFVQKWNDTAEEE